MNLAGQVLSLVAALAAIPYLVHGLGPERFGILSIAWAVLGPLSLFDLGLGQATTKFVAECLGRNQIEELPAVVWTSLSAQMLLGTAVALVAAAPVPLLVDHFLNVSPEAAEEARSCFFVLAGSFPVVMAGNALLGVVAATQRFDLLNCVKVPTSISIFLLPAVALMLGIRLPGIVGLLVLARLGAALGYLSVCMKLFPVLRHKFSFDPRKLKALLAYGGWVSVSNFLSPLLTYADRFVIGSVLTMSSVGYYTAPNEVITKAWVLPASLVATLFPAFSSLDAGGAKDKVEEICVRSLKSLVLLMGPCVLLVMVFAPSILRLWLGADFAVHSTAVLQIFCAGTFATSLAYIPYFLLQGVGRPDLTAKFHLLEVPFYAVALWVLLPWLGLKGAALAWTFRLCLDAVFLFGAAFSLRLISLHSFLRGALQKALLTVVALGVSLLLPAMAGIGLPTQVMWSGILLLLFAIAAWKYVLDPKEKSLFHSAAGQAFAFMGGAK